jgi:hypothetical protein
MLVFLLFLPISLRGLFSRVAFVGEVCSENIQLVRVMRLMGSFTVSSSNPII